MSINQKISISCSGEDKNSQHPKVYITFEKNKSNVICPYCGKIFHKNEIKDTKE